MRYCKWCGAPLIGKKNRCPVCGTQQLLSTNKINMPKKKVLEDFENTDFEGDYDE